MLNVLNHHQLSTFGKLQPATGCSTFFLSRAFFGHQPSALIPDFKPMCVVKPYLIRLLRSARLLNFFETLRFRLNQRRYKASNEAFLKAHPGFQLPPDFFLYETYMLDYNAYYSDGRATAYAIIELIKKFDRIDQRTIRCLDWGCGPARITRHLPGLLPGSEIYGIDYNEQYIQWCTACITGVTFKQAGIAPPTSFAGEHFDLIIGLSVFTHLSAMNHHAWINELYRIVKPGGMLFITTQGACYASKLLAGEKKRFNAGQLVVRDKILEGNRLFSSFQPVSFFQSLIEDKFEILEFIPGQPGSKIPEQDQWVLKRK